MTTVATENSEWASVARLANDRMPDWMGWWSLEDVCATLAIPDECKADVEALLWVRVRGRAAVIEASQKSQQASKYFEALRDAGIGQPDAVPDLSTRATLAQLASRLADGVFEELMQLDRTFADSVAALFSRQGTDGMPSDATVERMRRGVQRLRCFDPALSPMTLMNTGVDLTIQVGPLLRGESCVPTHADSGADAATAQGHVQRGLDDGARNAIVVEIAAWQERVAPQLDLFEKQRMDLVAVTGGFEPLEARLRHLTRLKKSAGSIRETLLATTLRSARMIAALAAEHDGDRASEWLRSVYHAFAPSEVGLTAGDSVLECAMSKAQREGAADCVLSLAVLRSRNLRECAELEGAFVDAGVRASGEISRLVAFMAHEGLAHKINQRRFVQADLMLKQVVALLPAQSRDEINAAFEGARRARTSRYLDQP